MGTCRGAVVSRAARCSAASVSASAWACLSNRVHQSINSRCQISNHASVRRVQLQKTCTTHPPSAIHQLPTSFSINNHSQQHQSQFFDIIHRVYSQPQTTHFPPTSINMPPKAADKKPASKAPATASKAPEKKDAGKKTAATGEKKKRTKARKETYSSYIYKGESLSQPTETRSHARVFSLFALRQLLTYSF